MNLELRDILGRLLHSKKSTQSLFLASDIPKHYTYKCKETTSILWRFQTSLMKYVTIVKYMKYLTYNTYKLC